MTAPSTKELAEEDAAFASAQYRAEMTVRSFAVHNRMEKKEEGRGTRRQRQLLQEVTEELLAAAKENESTGPGW